MSASLTGDGSQVLATRVFRGRSLESEMQVEVHRPACGSPRKSALTEIVGIALICDGPKK